jgi:tripartite-type tricarboxylate transporter receptor subunit TctC
MRKSSLALAALLVPLALFAAAAAADEIADFYAGRQMRVILGTAPGSADDSAGRLLGRAMMRHLPGHPTLVVDNDPTAGSLNTANTIFNTAPRDGSVFGTSHSVVLIMPLLGMRGPRFDARKLAYIGSVTHSNGICFAWKPAGFHSVADMRARDFLVGTTGAGTELLNFYGTITQLLGARLKLISGYSSSLEMLLAIEKGELEGQCGYSYRTLKVVRPQWIAERKIDILLQLALSSDPELAGAPLLGDLVADPDDRRAIALMLAPSEIERPYFLPPEVPPARVAALRAAFQAAIADPDLLADFAKQQIDLAPNSGADVEAAVARIYATPGATVARVKALVPGAGAVD